MPTLLRTLVEATGLSRRNAFAAVRAGRVTVDAAVVTDPSGEYAGGVIALDGADVAAAPSAKTYLLLNKPSGCVSTTSDERGRRTVLDLVPAGLRAPGLHPVGRLDIDTTGLLLLTNDGELTFRLTHPRHEVEKEYLVRTLEPAADVQLEAARRGVEIDGELRRPLRLRRLAPGAPFELSVTIREGRKRQVRRMFEAVGLRVTALRRVREGPLGLGDLSEGSVRRLSRAEVDALKDQQRMGNR